jgi:hypothetical protein
MADPGTVWWVIIRGRNPSKLVSKLGWAKSEKGGNYRDLLMRNDGSTPERISLFCMYDDHTTDVSEAFDLITDLYLSA